tara:strand:- start:159 stop:839 length:681 start_codon:yes stop_codon:yes gene_type:complete
LEISMQWIYYIILFSVIFGNIDKNEYEIKLYGFNVAKCEVYISDTLYNSKECTKIEYKVKSINFMDIFFNIKNYYLTIIDNQDFSIKYYQKNTIQPKIHNILETKELNNRIFYSDNEYEIFKNEYNIFSFLYGLSSGRITNSNKSFIIDREGKKYNAIISVIGADYKLTTDEITSKSGVIEHTDIFSWGLFLPNTEKIIRFNRENNIIESCQFQKGLLKFRADLIK